MRDLTAIDAIRIGLCVLSLLNIALLGRLTHQRWKRQRAGADVDPRITIVVSHCLLLLALAGAQVAAPNRPLTWRTVACAVAVVLSNIECSRALRFRAPVSLRLVEPSPHRRRRR